MDDTDRLDSSFKDFVQFEVKSYMDHMFHQFVDSGVLEHVNKHVLLVHAENKHSDFRDNREIAKLPFRYTLT